MNILVSGALGHMGQIIIKKLKDDNNNVFGFDRMLDNNNFDFEIFNDFNNINKDINVIIDFSHHSLTNELIDFSLKKNIPIVIGTTGQNEEEINIIKNASKNVPIFFAANYSMGIVLLIDSAKKIAKIMNDADIEIVEVHHNRKLDAPSGTALTIANSLKEVRTDCSFCIGRNGHNKRDKKEIGINSIRMGNVVGIHEVMITTNNECITIKHEAYDRAVFADGAIIASKFIVLKQNGLYDMNDLIK